MSERDPKPPTNFDDLEPLPAEAEMADLPEEALMDLPDEIQPIELEELPELEELDGLEELSMEPIREAKPAGKAAPAAPAPAPKEAPQDPVPSVPAQAAPASPVADASAKAGARPANAPVAPVTAAAASDSAGSPRASRAGREERAPKVKTKSWERWPGPGEKPKREMEAAPALLRKAALGLLIGCLLPWGGVTADWAGNIVEKLLVLGGLFVWHETNSFRDGLPVKGFITKLGATSFVPLFALAGLLTLLGFAPLLSHESLFADFKSNGGPIAEKGFMILAGLTLTHIHSYEHGGKFNPMFPIMFLAPAIAGVMAVLKSFSAESIGLGQILGGLGALAVSGAGWVAAYTMYAAIQEARVHGEAKKLAQVEARKAARAARK